MVELSSVTLDHWRWACCVAEREVAGRTASCSQNVSQRMRLSCSEMQWTLPLPCLHPVDAAASFLLSSRKTGLLLSVWVFLLEVIHDGRKLNTGGWITFQLLTNFLKGEEDVIAKKEVNLHNIIIFLSCIFTELLQSSEFQLILEVDKKAFRAVHVCMSRVMAGLRESHLVVTCCRIWWSSTSQNRLKSLRDSLWLQMWRRSRKPLAHYALHMLCKVWTWQFPYMRSLCFFFRLIKTELWIP